MSRNTQHFSSFNRNQLNSSPVSQRNHISQPNNRTLTVGSTKAKNNLQASNSARTSVDKAKFTPSMSTDDDDNILDSISKIKKVKKVPGETEDIASFQSATPKKPIASKPLTNAKTVSTKPATTAASQAASRSNFQNLQPTEPKKKGPARASTQKGAQKGNSSTEKDLPQDMLIDIEKNEGAAFDDSNLEDNTPEWAKKENSKDARGRRPGHPEFDPTTLYIPPNALNDLTPTMRQYWQIKSQNNDKIILFKIGKFYELFFEDAMTCHKELDLNWMGNKMSVGFPEKTLDAYAYTLVNRGYKVCVVEQTETPKQMEERLKLQKTGKKEKIVRREVIQVMSKGTFVDPNANFEARILLSVRCRDYYISVVFLEIGSTILTMGAFQDDENYTTFKTFISQVRPLEVIYETLETDVKLLKVIKNCPTHPVLSPINDPKAWNHIQAYGELENYYGPTNNWPEGLREIVQSEGRATDQIMISMAGMITYLTKMMIVENVFCTVRYEIYDPAKAVLSRMVLDSQALQHLEILEVEYATKNAFEGSLLHYIDKTVSPFGKRLLKKWICAPLLDINAINARLDAIEDLEMYHDLRDQFRTELRSLPDLERICAKIYGQSVRKNQTVVLFEDVSVGKLKEFKKLIDNLKKARNIVSQLSEADFKSGLLIKLTAMEEVDQTGRTKSNNIPEISPLLKEMAEFVSWEGPKQDIPVPKPGIDSDYDSCKQEINAIENELTKHLKNIQARFGGNREICFAHIKHRYEVEIPTKLVEGNKKPKDFEFSSKKQDRERFVTQPIKQLVEALEEVEERLKQTLNVFVCFLFNYFHKHYAVWDRFIESLAQLDCLCSLSLTSFMADGTMCRPNLYSLNDAVFFNAKGTRHPCVSMNKPNFVSNDIVLGDVQEEENSKNVVILTGPNMGGKSTILRQVCILSILAQIGCYVPASSCSFSVVDRVFTRLGASDKLSEGKSTFFIEMEETANILKYGTQNSLAIIDELGRGTSTFDGVAIAYSTLRYIMKRLGCRTLFATHYHVLLDEFRGDHMIGFYHMGSRIDHENGRIVFLYRLAEGECSNSFGLNIAKLSGLGMVIVKRAKEKADEFEKNFNIREAVRANKTFGNIMKALKVGKKDLKEGLALMENALKGL